MDKAIRKIKYSEIFSETVQGEAHHCGKPTIWIRLWGCPFECQGFGQKNLDDPTTWDLPYQTFDISNITKLEELPVWHTGCDSSYSFSKKFSKLATSETAAEIAIKLIESNKNQFNLNGTFLHPRSGQETHMAFTGGEPMMNQQGIVDIMEAMHSMNKNSPVNVTVETNGTRPVKDYFKDFIEERFYRYENVGGMMTPEREASEWFWSVSPKLRTSGEKWEDAIKPDVVASYAALSSKGQLKFVVDGDDRTWYEVEKATKLFREAGVDFPVWIMPVGADLEMQQEHAAKIARESIARGYNVAARVHIYLFGNLIGT